MTRVLVVDLGREASRESVSFLGEAVDLERVGCEGRPDRAAAAMRLAGEDVGAIALDGLPRRVWLGHARERHRGADLLPERVGRAPVVDGLLLRDALERWGVTLAARMEPGVFAKKRVLMVPGFNHVGLSQALGRYASAVRYADPVTHFLLPDLPGVGRRLTLEQAAFRTVEQLAGFPYRRLMPPAGQPRRRRAQGPFCWADVLAGDVGTIRRYAPPRLDGKTVVVEHATEEDAADLARRGARLLVTLMPSPEGRGAIGRWSAAVIEAVLVALRHETGRPLTEDAYLDLIADLDWAPTIRYLQTEDADVGRFAFVIHPLSVGFIHSDRRFRWTKVLPDGLVEALAAYMPPLALGRITGARSEATGRRVEGLLISLGATPRQMMRHAERFTYRRLNLAARMAERFGARIMGLGAFTSVVGDAGVTVAHEADIAVTSGNSLTVAATLEAAKRAVLQMGARDLTHGTAMIVGATGSIGAVCARLLAQAIGDVVLVSIEPEKLIDLKRRILAETPGARVTIATRTEEAIASCDLVVTATSAFGQRVVDISRCKPGAVICDVARPPDISEAEAALRPDVLVIESGEVVIPGEVDFGYDIGLPPGTSYACLAETALLAMEGRFEDYTVGRQIDADRVREVYRLFKKHGFRLARLRSHGAFLTEEDVARRRTLAEELRRDRGRAEALQAEAAARLARLPAMSKGVTAERVSRKTLAWMASGATLAASALYFAQRRRERRDQV